MVAALPKSVKGKIRLFFSVITAAVPCTTVEEVTEEKAKNLIALYGALLTMNEKCGAEGPEEEKHRLIKESIPLTACVPLVYFMPRSSASASSRARLPQGL